MTQPGRVGGCMCMCVFAAACASPGGPATESDAGADAIADAADAADAAADAPPDAGLAPCISDPASPDHDGDGVGWDCDPVESVTIGAALGYSPLGSVSHERAAGLVTLSCAQLWSNCTYGVVALAPEGLLATTTDAAAAPWATASVMAAPLVTTDGQILLPRVIDPSTWDTLALDVTAQIGTTRSPLLPGRVLRDGGRRPLLVWMHEPGIGYGDVVEPRGGSTLQLIASRRATWFGLWLGSDGDAIAPDDPPYVVEQTQISGGGVQPLRLHRYTPGTDTLVPLDPPVEGAEMLVRLGEGTDAPWCASTATSMVHLAPTPLGLSPTLLPFLQCERLTRRLSAGGTELIIGTGRDLAANGSYAWTAAYLRGGTLHTVFSGVEGLIQTVGDDTLVLTVAPYDTAKAAQVWVIWPDDTIALLASDLASVAVSTNGPIVHVAGIQVGETAMGPLVARRYRQGQAVQEATLFTGVTAPTDVRVVTSREGAALVSFSSFPGWIAPSSAFTFTQQFELHNLGGGARTSGTLVFTGVTPTGDSSTGAGAAFAYDEPGGVPRLTRLTADTFQWSARLLDPTTAPTDDIIMAPCTLGRLSTGANGVPQLTTVDCGIETDSRLPLGVTAAGETVWGNQSLDSRSFELLAIGAAGARVLERGEGNLPTAIQPLLERSTAPARFLGWVALEAAGSMNSRMCVTDPPARCWRIPDGATVLDTRIEPGPTGPRVSVLLFDQTAGTNRFTVVRSIGPGDLPAP